MSITNKYVLNVKDKIRVGKSIMTLYPEQMETMIKDTGVTFFDCPYSSNFYFVNATDEQYMELHNSNFIDWIESYDEKEFQFSYVAGQRKYEVDEINFATCDSKIKDIINKLNTLIKIKHS